MRTSFPHAVTKVSFINFESCRSLGEKFDLKIHLGFEIKVL